MTELKWFNPWEDDMNIDEKLVNPAGIGGYKCFCCGPRKGERKPWRRLIRSRLKVVHRLRVDRALVEIANP